jgi:hypothetical protein
MGGTLDGVRARVRVCMGVWGGDAYKVVRLGLLPLSLVHHVEDAHVLVQQGTAEAGFRSGFRALH